jgi:hypothetical protein
VGAFGLAVEVWWADVTTLSGSVTVTFNGTTGGEVLLFLDHVVATGWDTNASLPNVQTVSTPETSAPITTDAAHTAVLVWGATTQFDQIPYIGNPIAPALMQRYCDGEGYGGTMSLLAGMFVGESTTALTSTRTGVTNWPSQQRGSYSIQIVDALVLPG